MSDPSSARPCMKTYNIYVWDVAYSLLGVSVDITFNLGITYFVHENTVNNTYIQSGVLTNINGENYLSYSKRRTSL